MFEPTPSQIQAVADAFGVASPIRAVEELRRYRYERDDPASRQIRLIVKTIHDDGARVVTLKYEDDTSPAVIEAQCAFADTLRENGVATPRFYRAEGRRVLQTRLNGFDLWATVQDFMPGELAAVDESAARQTGRLLARTHNIAEACDLHVSSPVLFDPFGRNDLFFPDEFLALRGLMNRAQKPLFDEIAAVYRDRVRALEPLRDEPRYAVQGDISNNNLFRLPDGALGLYDFNRCGDNNLFADAVMQAVFEARLMDYAGSLGEDREARVLDAFLAGYADERPFSDRQRRFFPALYAVITAFWGEQIVFGDRCLTQRARAGDEAVVTALLERARAQIRAEKPLEF